MEDISDSELIENHREFVSRGVLEQSIHLDEPFSDLKFRMQKNRDPTLERSFSGAQDQTLRQLQVRDFEELATTSDCHSMVDVSGSFDSSGITHYSRSYRFSPASSEVNADCPLQLNSLSRSFILNEKLVNDSLIVGKITNCDTDSSELSFEPSSDSVINCLFSVTGSTSSHLPQDDLELSFASVLENTCLDSTLDLTYPDFDTNITIASLVEPDKPIGIAVQPPSLLRSIVTSIWNGIAAVGRFLVSPCPFVPSF